LISKRGESMGIRNKFGSLIKNYRAGLRESALSSAIMDGNTDAARREIEHEPSIVNVPVSIGLTYLCLAAFYGRKEIAEILINHNAEINVVATDNRFTPLSIAAFRGHKDVVELLLANKADVNAKDKEGRTAIDWVEKEHPEIAELLRNRLDN
jgi:ankyrin repeat protein